MMRLFAILLVLVVGAAPGRAQEIVTDLSDYEIELRHTFTGQELLLFGALKGGEPALTPGFDVVIVISGAEKAYLVRRKERVLGIWVNTDTVTFERVPGYYSIASTRPLGEIAPEAVRESLMLGPQYHLHDPDPALGEEELTAFGHGLIVDRTEAGLYRVSTEAMPVIDGTLFKASFFFPSNVPSGSYEASAYLFRDGALVSRATKTIRIDKAGIERAVFNLAHRHPALYGLMAVVIALLAGWLAGIATRRRTKLG